MSDDERLPAPTLDPLAQALSKPDLLRIYANGFALGITNADAHVILHQNTQPIAVVNLSYTLAKTLSLKLGQLVAEWETRLGQQLVTTDKIA